MTQCKAKFVNKLGEELRCEDEQGHRSAHYCGNEWWPNADGLPKYTAGLPNGWDSHKVVGLLLAGVLVGGVLVMWLIIHFSHK